MIRWLVPVCVVVSMASSGELSAQNYGQTAINQIVRQSVGQGYTIDSVNKLSMNNARGIVVDPTTNKNMVQDLSSPDPALNRSAATFNSFGGGGPSAKPFSSASRGPTVSPYLNLFQEGLSDDFDTYNTLVRPQLRQQQVNQSLQLETQAIDRKVRSYAAKPAFNPQGSTQQSPTGHPTGFMYYSHFYPGMTPQRGR